MLIANHQNNFCKKILKWFSPTDVPYPCNYLLDEMVCIISNYHWGTSFSIYNHFIVPKIYSLNSIKYDSLFNFLDISFNCQIYKYFNRLKKIENKLMANHLWNPNRKSVISYQ